MVLPRVQQGAAADHRPGAARRRRGISQAGSGAFALARRRAHALLQGSRNRHAAFHKETRLAVWQTARRATARTEDRQNALVAAPATGRYRRAGTLFRL